VSSKPKLLANENIPLRSVQALRNDGYADRSRIRQIVLQHPYDEKCGLPVFEVTRKWASDISVFVPSGVGSVELSFYRNTATAAVF